MYDVKAKLDDKIKDVPFKEKKRIKNRFRYLKGKLSADCKIMIDTKHLVGLIQNKHFNPNRVNMFVHKQLFEDGLFSYLIRAYDLPFLTEPIVISNKLPLSTYKRKRKEDSYKQIQNKPQKPTKRRKKATDKTANSTVEVEVEKRDEFSSSSELSPAILNSLGRIEFDEGNVIELSLFDPQVLNLENQEN